MKIYTRTGDKGETGLLGGSRVLKSSYRIHAIGEVDELNAWLGSIRSFVPHTKIDAMLHDIQQNLFNVGAQLANPVVSSIKITQITSRDCVRLEQWIDELEKDLPPLKHFILPGGDQIATMLHVSRAVCRRAERAVVALHEKESIVKNIIVFLNRLSDLLFVMARWQNAKNEIQEEEWKA